MEFVERFEEALKKGYIKAYYQPLIRSLSGNICGAEALARWEDPEKGIIQPNDFISLLEENKLIHKLDLAMLENVCKLYQKNKFKDITYSLNLSGIDFELIDMFKEITTILKKYNVPTSAIHLEITESTMIHNTDNVRRLFEKFHNAGFEIWVDDFGSGFSSLNVLRDYDFDVLKIDMSLIQKFDFSSKKILSSIVNMAKLLGMRSLAEGVETKEQEYFLKNIGCEIIQGFYYSRALNENEFLNYLSNNSVETKNDYKYWNDAGKINFLSADPLMSSSYYSNEIFGVSPLAFIEYEKGNVKYVFVNDAYRRELKTVGYDSIDDLVRDVNDDRFEHYDRYMRQIENTIFRGGVQRIDSISKDVVFSHFTKLIASEDDKHLIASSFYTISSKRSDYLVLKYSQSLYMTYDCVTEITPDKDGAVQIYSTSGFAKVYGTASLRKGIKEFTENEVHPDDRKKYLEFFDLDTLKDRMVNDYIQESFRVRSGNGYKWKNIRISKVDVGKYLYTIQSF